VSQPDQAILIIRGREFSWAAEYLHYWKTSGDGWRFSGEKSVGERNAPSEHRLMQIGDKPFFVISGDYSQIGFAIHQVLEDWFDLTQKSFEPVFSVTVDGSHWRFAFGVGRTIHADYVVSQTAGLERIGLTLSNTSACTSGAQARRRSNCGALTRVRIAAGCPSATSQS
jgi:hypothetical protein